MLPLILASTSSFRQHLLTKLGLPFIATSPNVNETPLYKEPPRDCVIRLAKDKVHAVSSQYPQHIIIAADQVCWLNGTITGKPLNTQHACEQLQDASGKKVTFYTGLAVLNTRTASLHTVCELYHVYFRILSHAEINHYVKIEHPLECAGSFKSEGLGITLFDKLEGNDPNTLVGLPLIALSKLLRLHGYDPLLNHPMVNGDNKK